MLSAVPPGAGVVGVVVVGVVVVVVVVVRAGRVSVPDVYPVALAVNVAGVAGNAMIRPT